MKRRILLSILAVVAFVAWLTVGVLVHLRVPVARRVAQKQVTSLLASSFAGQIKLDGLEGLSLAGVEGAHATVVDPDGVRVIALEHVDVDVSVINTIRNVVNGDTLVIDRIRIAGADVNLDSAPDGSLRIANTFQPKGPTPSSSPSTLRVQINDIEILHAWTHGVMRGQIIDVDVDRLLGDVRVDPSVTQVDLDRAHVAARAMPRGANPRGAVRGRLTFDETLHLVASFQGDVGGVPANARGALDDDRVAAIADVPPADASLIRALVPEAPIHDRVFAHFEASGITRAVGFAGVVGLGNGRVRATGRYVAPSLDAHLALRDLDARTFSPSAPKTDFGGDFDVHTNLSDVDASGRATLPGATADLKASLVGSTALGRVDLVVHDGARLVAELAPTVKLDGHGELHASGRFDTNSHVFFALAKGAFAGLEASGVSVESVAFTASATGAAASPVIAVDAQARALRRGGIRLREVDASIHGGLAAADVTLRGSGLGEIDVNGRVELPTDGVRVRGLRIDGVGEPISGSLEWLGGRGHVVIASRDVDLARVHTLLGMESPLYGDVAFDADVRSSGDSVQGHATIDASRIELDQVHGGGLHLEVAALGNMWSLVARAHESRFGWASVEANDLRPAGSPFQLASWKAAKGSVRVDTQANLSSIRILAPSFVATGRVRAGVTVSRKDTLPPDVVLTVATEQLSVALPSGEATSGVDLTFQGHLEPDGKLLAHAEATGVASVDLLTTIPYAVVLRGDLEKGALETTPFKLDASIAKRDGAPLCKLLGVSCEGNVEALVHVEGTAATPRGTVHASLEGFAGKISPVSMPMNGTVDGSYDGKGVQVKLYASTAKDEWLDAHAEVTELSADWSASLIATLHDLPVRAPGELQLGRLRARANGQLELVGLHKDARVNADVQLDGIEVEGAKLGHADITGGFDGSKLSAAVHMKQPDGDADFLGEAVASWGAKMAPVLSDSAPATLSGRAHNLRIKAAQALLSNTFDVVDGRLDGDARASIAHGSSVAVSGWASIKQGILHSASFGELHDIEGRASMASDGSLWLDGARARGMTGEVTATGIAHVRNGVIQDATFSPRITRKDAFPLITDGEHLADVWGQLKVTIKPQGDGWNVDTEVPSLHVIVPDSEGRSPQKLDAKSDVVLGTRTAQGFVPLLTTKPMNALPKSASQPSAVHLVIHLGDDVEIKQGTTLSAFLRGDPAIEIGDDLRVRGRIAIVRGRLDVQGKRFDIERGTVTFNGDPQNPIVVVTASWMAPDGTQVFADYTGPLQGGKVTLRSEPSRPHNEIVSLLVFGTADGPNSGGPGTDAQTTALGAGAAYAVQPFNKAMDQLTHLDIVARVDTSAPNPKPEVEVQIAKNISAMVAVVLGVPSPGDNPDVYWLTLAWRMRTRWTLEATVGDRGSSIIDLFWQHRY